MDTYKNNQRKNDSVAEILRIHTVPQLLNKKLQITENIRSLNDLVADNEEMKKLAEEEELTYKQQLWSIDEEILHTILQSVGSENYDNVILEILPGVGGQEAMLFARDLLEMYLGYLNYLDLNHEIMELDKSEQDGIRKATIVISDPKAYDKLKYEGGVHRVQRVPVTEKSGRLHTSTASVAILPEPKNIEVILEEKDLKIEAKKASGAGGQHVNTTDSAIRVVHVPTGITVTCQQDRSQTKNKSLALMKLKSLLFEQQLNKQITFITKLRQKQMGTKLRNEKIRTYNYNQDRVTDHRIPDGTLHHLKDFMKGGEALEELEERLHRDMQYKILQEIVQTMESELK